MVAMVTFINSEYPGSSFLRHLVRSKLRKTGCPVSWVAMSQAKRLTQTKRRSQPLLENGRLWLPRSCPVSKDSEGSGISYCKYSKSSRTQNTKGRTGLVPGHSRLTQPSPGLPRVPLLLVQAPCSLKVSGHVSS